MSAPIVLSSFSTSVSFTQRSLDLDFSIWLCFSACCAQMMSGRRSRGEGTGVEQLGRCWGGERHPFLGK
ncbi:MAG: hypothetical protein KJS98_18065, partial [Nitrospirae bacterium]|nr:hypothetical protein [Nitrospirota bacterium]